MCVNIHANTNVKIHVITPPLEGWMDNDCALGKLLWDLLPNFSQIM